jgi:hypothetical protein
LNRLVTNDIPLKLIDEKGGDGALFGLMGKGVIDVHTAMRVAEDVQGIFGTMVEGVCFAVS